MSNKIERAIKGSLVYPRGFGSTLSEKELSQGKVICGLDTEADALTADPYLLTYSFPDYTHFLEGYDSPKLIEFLTSHKFRDTVNFFYNLQYDFEGSLKLFPKDAAIMIYGTSSCYLDEKIHLVDKEDSKHRLSYIPKKAFHIKSKGAKKYSYYDSLQYFQMSLQKAAMTYLGVGKDDFKSEFSSKPLFELKSTIDKEINRFSDNIKLRGYSDDEEQKKLEDCREFFTRFVDADDYRNTLLQYALTDAKRCRQLSEILVEGVNKFLNTRNFNSTATISEYYFRGKGISVPRLQPAVQKKFMESYYGGRFEIFKRGFLSGVSMFDIKSAYPFAMSDMPILSKHPVIKNVNMKHDRALYGTYCIDAKIPSEYYVSPLPIREKLVLFPVGKFERYWTDKLSLEVLEDLGIPYKLRKAVEIYDDNAEPKLKEWILYLFNIKEDKKNPEVLRMAAKIILNALYGKFIQLVDDSTLEIVDDIMQLDNISPQDLFNIMDTYYQKIHTTDFKTGKMFAPYYAAYITAHTRKILFQTAHKYNWEKIVGMHTDSIIFQDRELPIDSKLGGWELESMKKFNDVGELIGKVPVHNADIILLKSGFYECKKDGAQKIKSRGIGKTDTLLKEEFKVRRRFGLRQAVKKDFEDMNIIFDNQPIENNVNADSKRHWFKDLSVETIREGEWTDSEPLVF